MVFPSTTGVSVRVLRTMFVPGCGGPYEFVNSVSFSHFLPTVIPSSPRSVSYLLSPHSIIPPVLQSSLDSLLLSFPYFLFTLFPLFFILSSSSSFYPFLLFFPSSPSTLRLQPALLPASKVPWEPCGSSAGRHTNTTAATTGTSLCSLPSLSLARFFFSSLLYSLSPPFFLLSF